MANPFEQELPPMSVVVRGDDSAPITLDDAAIKSLVARALLDAGELVSELAAQGAVEAPQGDPAGPDGESDAFGAIIWDVDLDLVPEATQVEILRLVRAGFVLCLRDAVSGVHPDVDPGA